MKNLESVRECENHGRKALCDMCRERIDSAIAERDAMKHALECIWSGVPDNLRKTLDANPDVDNGVVLIHALMGALRKVKNALA